MSVILVTAGIAAGTPIALLSLACLAALSAYRRQAAQDREEARVWARPPARPANAGPVLRPLPPRRPPVPAACAVIPKPPRRIPAPAKRRAEIGRRQTD